MRILLAIDGSAAAGHARDLVDRIEWPPETAIRVVGALHRISDRSVAPSIPSPDADPADADVSTARRVDDALEIAVHQLERPGRVVDRLVLRGRAASAIVNEAREFNADLIVVGNRGHSRLQTMLLGSVSAEVVAHAPCPVLVARDATVSRILLAVDGSTHAEHATRVLLDWPIFAGRLVTVLMVAEVALPWGTGMSAGVYDQVLESYTEEVDEARSQSKAIAEATAARLTEAGYEANGEVREGDPSEEIVAAAAAAGTDLIVMGTRGHTGLARLVMGSIARNVLTHAPCSVLIVREKARVEPVVAHRPDPATTISGG
jgi:nucleotide-binding universal stress UspA family protein